MTEMSQLVQKHSETPDLQVRIASLSCPSCEGSHGSQSMELEEAYGQALDTTLQAQR